MTAPAPTRPAVSVVICVYTLRRWEQLLDAVHSVDAQLGAGDEVLVVVDHNDELFERLIVATANLTGVRILRNTAVRGLSGGRNTGVEASTGDVVAFLDDDAIARPDWLERLRLAFEADERVLVAGTAVEPRWDGGSAPRWFPPEFGWVVGCGYRGLPTQRAAIRNPIGASMAVRRSAFVAAGRFSDLVSKVDKVPIGCDETEFCIRLARARPEALVIHEPASAVDHVVPTDRQTLRYFVHRCFTEGRCKWTVTRLGGSRAGLSSERRYVRVVLPAGVARGLVQSVTRFDPFALARAGSIGLGLGVTLTGFAFAAGQHVVARVRGRRPKEVGHNARRSEAQ